MNNRRTQGEPRAHPQAAIERRPSRESNDENKEVRSLGRVVTE